MFWFTENHFLIIGLLDWGNAETQTFSVSRNRDGIALAESRTIKSGTVAPLVKITFGNDKYLKILCLNAEFPDETI